MTAATLRLTERDRGVWTVICTRVMSTTMVNRRVGLTRVLYSSGGGSE